MVEQDSFFNPFIFEAIGSKMRGKRSCPARPILINVNLKTSFNRYVYFETN